MRQNHRYIHLTAGVLALAFLWMGMSPGSGKAVQERKESEKCCFTNPQYQGVCEVTPGKGETCASILAYLNNPNSVGKAYCGNTTIRGGWRQVPCGEGQTASCFALGS